MQRDVDTDRAESADVTPAARQPRDPLIIITAIALAGTGVMFAWGTYLATRGDDPEYDLMSFSVLLLASAGIALIRRSWAPLPGTVLAVVVTFLSPLFQEYTAYHLTHPQEFASFAPVLMLQGFGLVASVTGAAAYWRGRGGRVATSDGLPRWTQLLVSAVAAAVVTGLVFGAGVASGAIATGTGSGNGTVPADATEVEFVAGAITFQQAPDEAPAGPLAIRLDNRDTVLHDVAIESVHNDQPIVVVDPGDTGTGTVELGAGTYTYYCSVPGHREAGMEGSLTITGP